MSSGRLNEWPQVTGLAGVIASLCLVGLHLTSRADRLKPSE